MATNKNIILVLGAGFFIAIFVAVFVNATLGAKTKKQNAQAEQKVEIIVLTEDISTGKDITEKNVVFKAWPRSALFPGLIVKKKDQTTPLDAVKGKVVRDLKKGEPLTRSALIDGSKETFLAASLEKGYRAMAIKVNAETAAGGFMGPGDYADILLTYATNIRWYGDDREQANQVIDDNIDKQATEIILENIKVLAVDQTMQRETQKIKVGKTVTVQVTPEQAEILTMASRMGTLSLTLRGLGDHKITLNDNDKRRVVTDERITKIRKEIMQEVRKNSNDTGGGKKNVRIYSGGSITDVEIQ
jgi:pilus assembly protein CpaB